MARPILFPFGAFLGVLSALAAEPDLKSFQLHPELEIQLWAREPDVVDPVALTFDEHGRLFVVEMRDYPEGVRGDRKPGGTVRLLEDVNGDGRPDRSHLFAENLSYPTSIAPWNGGVLVTAPPEIIFLKDADGDGRAEIREVLFRGFVLGVTDSNVNGLRWGLDNRVHGANGGNGGTVQSLRKPGPGLSLRGLDFSFDPVSGDLTATTSTAGGFGLVFDEWGRSFTTYNIDHIQQRVMPRALLSRFPGLPPMETTVDISDHEPMSRIFPISLPETRPNHPEQSGHFSSAGGMGFISHPAYPGDLRGSVLVCDVVGNLVHRDLLVPDGPVFIARRSPVEQDREFLASRDNAFRPVGIEEGPDGALYLIDMQREVIEHPDYIPQKLKEKQNIRAGEDRGRIYRLAPQRGLGPRPPLPGGLSPAEWVGMLAHSNRWHRMSAQRLLWEKQDRSAVPALRAMAREHREPLARLHALWTLEGLAATDLQLVEEALKDPAPGVRENAVLLAMRWMRKSPGIADAVALRSDDPDPRVRFVCALALGEQPAERRAGPLEKILVRDHAHRWTRVAVMSSLPSGEAALLDRLLARHAEMQSPGREALYQELSDWAAARGRASEVVAMLEPGKLPGPALQAVLSGLETGHPRARSREVAPETAARLDALAREADRPLLAGILKVARRLGLPASPLQQAAIAAAARSASDRSLEPGHRILEIELLALAEWSQARPTLLALLSSREPVEIQREALRALRQFNHPETGKLLMEGWRQLSPRLRTEVVQLLVDRTAYHEALVAALERKEIHPGELNLDLEQRRRLLRFTTPRIATRAARFFGDEEYSNRKTVADEWMAKLPATGDPARGQPVFERLCSSCHTRKGAGHAVGPDLSDLAHRSVEDLLYHIVDPNMALNPNYVSYQVVAGDEVEIGLLKSESPESIVLLQAQGVEKTIPRRTITRLETTGISLMPEGLENDLTPQALRDLIAFLQAR